MSKLTKTTETLPKSGHVTEVCKEWLVREDGALAYKLQSQEITDFYKGNRFRNAVVREDFPTALHEQIKEKENADKQAECYRRYLTEQEQHDKEMAKEITDKLERDLLEQQQRELEDSELIAQQLQEIYVNIPPPPPTIREKRPPPPRPEKASILHPKASIIPTSAADGCRIEHHKQQEKHHHHRPSQHRHTSPTTTALHQQQPPPFHFSNGFSVVDAASLTPLRHKPINSAPHQHMLVSDSSLVSPSSPSPSSSEFNQFIERPKNGRTPPALTNDNLSPFALAKPPSSHQRSYHHHQSLSSSSPLRSRNEPASPPLATTKTTITSHHLQLLTPQHQPNHQHTRISQSHSHSHPDTIEEIVEYTDVADSIRQYDLLSPHQADSPDSPKNFNPLHSTPSHENLLRADYKFQKLSPEKYDQLIGNGNGVGDGIRSSASSSSSSNVHPSQRERLMQQHADDIELYVDPCDYASLREIGLPMDEIKEMSKKIKQEQKDELLARQLQELEHKDGLTQEDRDRLLAIEAQDKELAKMLQEREKAKAKRAKEKARLRKSQYQKDTLQSSTNGSVVSGLHCGPLLALPQDFIPSSSSSTSTSRHSAGLSGAVVVVEEDEHEDSLDMEPYSNPIDLISNQRLHSGTMSSNNSSLSRDSIVGCATKMGTRLNGNVEGDGKDDDIYTLPVDSCNRAGNRPASLNITPEFTNHHNSMTRSENYSLDSHDMLNHDVSPRMNHSKSGGSFDKSSSPTPPYMPIQGTRRSNSNEDRKKRSRDKCTHQ